MFLFSLLALAALLCVLYSEGVIPNANQPGSYASRKTQPATQSKPLGWEYKVIPGDRINGEQKTIAKNISQNFIELPFPYEGECRVGLFVQKTSDYQIILETNKGQFVTEYIVARFDNGPVLKYTCSRPKDGSANMYFVDESENFLKNLRAAKVLTIEATYYRNGSQQFNYDVSGLNL